MEIPHAFPRWRRPIIWEKIGIGRRLRRDRVAEGFDERTVPGIKTPPAQNWLLDVAVLGEEEEDRGEAGGDVGGEFDGMVGGDELVGELMVGKNYGS
ncbi:unnamed protein product [Linum trigynum]|uniref:Uncharacterized protein n=1 Tax=Linum trigynum TaxID=586398 RepID=A0AAV2FW30_9ROSI